MELNFVLKCKKWNLPTDWVQIVDEKNGVVCLVIMFTQEDLSVALKCFAKSATIFLLPSVENTKTAMFYALINSGSKHDFKHFLNTLNPFFKSTLWALSFGLFHICIPRTSKFHLP